MPVFRKDPCGFVCILMTYGAVLYADYVVVRWIILQTMEGLYYFIIIHIRRNSV